MSSYRWKQFATVICAAAAVGFGFSVATQSYVASASSFPVYRVTDLGVSSPQNAVVAISPNGTLAGQIAVPGSSMATELVIWHDGQESIIPLPSTYSSVAAIAVNDNNQILGNAVPSKSSNGVPVVVAWTSSGASWTALPEPQTGDAQPTAISDSGEVVGTTTGGRALIWTPNGGSYALRELGSGTSAAFSDNLGDVIGGSGTSAVVWSPSGSATPFGPTETNSGACGENVSTDENGISEGSSESGNAVLTIAGEVHQQYVCQPGGFGAPDDTAMAWEFSVEGGSVGLLSSQMIPFPSGAVCAGGSGPNCSWAVGINSSGTIVGIGNFTAGDSSWIDIGGQTTFLHSLLDSADQSAWRSFEPTGIDTAGDILALGTTSNSSPHSVLLTPQSQSSNPTIFTDNFDTQTAGALQTGIGTNQFTGTAGPSSNIRVVNYYSYSAPNSLGFNVEPGSSAYAYKTYGAGYSTHTLTFHVMLSPNFQLSGQSYVTIAGTEPANATSNAGMVELNVWDSGRVLVSYWNSAGQQQYFYPGGDLSRGSWNSVSLEETANSSGSLTVFIDGKSEGQVTGVNLGAMGVGAFAIGNIYASPGSTSGQLYFDDVSATTQQAGSDTHHATKRFAKFPRLKVERHSS